MTGRTFLHTGEAEWSREDRVWARVNQCPPPRNPFAPILSILKVGCAFGLGCLAMLMLAAFAGAYQ